MRARGFRCLICAIWGISRRELSLHSMMSKQGSDCGNSPDPISLMLGLEVTTRKAGWRRNLVSSSRKAVLWPTSTVAIVRCVALFLRSIVRMIAAARLYNKINIAFSLILPLCRPPQCDVRPLPACLALAKHAGVPYGWRKQPIATLSMADIINYSLTVDL